ncbi:hypothetical protein [Litorimonas sp. WD9-15]|uniref:hypothetical protein n=1 Tax=Litorimonas sp. WD9-15 TaxID=3418716 RepID=UPI003D07A5EF
MLAQDYGLSGPTQIETESLDAAQDFDAGILTEGALDTQLWQGTSANRAAKLLSTAPLNSNDPIIRDMVRTVILSGGVPPRAENESAAKTYESARLQAVMAVGEGEVLDGFLARNPELTRAPSAQVDLALAKGDQSRACEISDTITTGRGEPQWVRLRAACHALRGEMAAAELTRDLLRSLGYQNDAYYAQLSALIAGRPPAKETNSSDVLVTYLAKRSGSERETGAEAGRDADLAALFKNFATLDLASIENTLGNISFDVATPDLDLETALSEPSPRATARLFVLGRSGDAGALDAFISRATRAGVSEDDVLTKLSPIIQALPAKGRVDSNLKRYARAALLARDIGGLQGLYSALPEGGPAQARIALAADALGGGFNAQGLGRDIETRLTGTTTQAQALTDVVLAVALGARVSDVAGDVLAEANLPKATLPQSQMLLLNAAVDANSRAETTLRAATLLSRANLNTTDRAQIVTALRRAGLQRFAGQVAAEDFLAAL